VTSLPHVVIITMSTVSIGKEFENKVAELLRLMGYKVIHNIEICHKKVDILATLRIPGSDTLHRVIVECKHEEKNINQVARVREFKDLLREARERNKAESAEIITLKPWSDQAKGVALGSGVKLYTYTQKLAQLMNFDEYLVSTIEDFENDELSKYYIDLNAEIRISAKDIRLQEEGSPKEKTLLPIDTHISYWLQEEGLENQIAILGEFGSGKTSFCRHYAYELAKKYKMNEEERVRIPILFNLGKFTKNINLEDLIVGFLDRKCGVSNPKFNIFNKMNDEGLFLLMFDGFDEMAVQVDFDTILANLKEIEKLTKSPKSKVLLTSRREYFISAEEEEEIFAPRSLLEKERKFDRLHLVPLNESQIKSFLQQRIPLIEEAEEDWGYYLERIREIHDLTDLSKRPVMLDMITKTLPQLVRAKKPISAANLYQTYLEGEIKRQAVDKRRKLLIKREHRFLSMQALAVHFYVENLPGVTAKQVKELIKDKFTPSQQEELEAHLRDFLTCSFLIREGDYYRFSHRSIVEYLTSRELYDEIRKDKPDIFRINPLTKEIRDFILELQPDKAVLWRWIEITKQKSFDDVKYLGGNAISLLHLLGGKLERKDFSNTVLNNAYLEFADLTETDFKGAVLRNANLNRTILREADFSYADLEGASIGERDVIKRIAWSPDGKYIVAAIGDITHKNNVALGIWNAKTFENIRMLTGHTGFISDICWDSNMKHMVTSGYDHNLIIWDMKGFRIKMRVNPQIGYIWYAFSIRNSLILCCGSGFGVKLVDAETGKIEGAFMGKYSRIYPLGILDNFLIVALDANSQAPDKLAKKDSSRIVVWDMDSNKKIKSSEYDILSWCHLLDKSRKKIITAQNLDEKRPMSKIQLNEMDYLLQNESVLWNCGEPVWKMIWSPNAKLIALVIDRPGGSLIVWDYEERKTIAILEGHGELVYATEVSFSPDSKYLASGGQDKIIKIWDVDTKSETFGRCVHTIESQINCRRMKIRSVKGLSEEKRRFLQEQGAIS